MGREIRRVPPNWEHPQKEVPNYRLGVMEMRYQPLYDRTAQEAWEEWSKEFRAWKRQPLTDKRAQYEDKTMIDNDSYRAFCEWHGSPPDHEYYRPAWNEEMATWYQVYETVSEGTPVTPPFETEDELIEYLVKNGDFWDQARRERGDSFMECNPWSREQAERFVKGAGWAPSLVMSGDRIMSGVEALSEFNP